MGTKATRSSELSYMTVVGHLCEPAVQLLITDIGDTSTAAPHHRKPQFLVNAALLDHGSMFDFLCYKQREGKSIHGAAQARCHARHCRQPKQHPRLRGPLLHRLAKGTRLDNNAPPTPPSFHNRWIWFIAHLRSRVWLVWLLPVPFPAAGSRCLCSPGLRRGYERTRWCRPERGWC